MREVISAAEQQARHEPSNAQAAGALGQALHAWDQWEFAHGAYSRAAALAPGVFAWQYLDACVLQRLGRHTEAVGRLRKALEITPDYLPGRVKLAEALLETGALDESRRAFESLVSLPAAEPAARFGLGRIAAASGRQEDAIASFERAIALYPEWGAAHYALALSLRAVGRREDAQRAMQSHARYGTRWPPLADPVLSTVLDLRDDAASMLRRADALAESGDLHSRDRRQRGRAPARSVADGGPRTASHALRPDQGLGQRRTALQGRDADRIQPGRHPGTTTVCSSRRRANGILPRRRTEARSRSTRATHRRTTIWDRSWNGRATSRRRSSSIGLRSRASRPSGLHASISAARSSRSAARPKPLSNSAHHRAS